MRKTLFLAFAAVITTACSAWTDILDDLPPEPQPEGFGDLKFSGGTLTANRKTGETIATGDIKATSGVYSFFTDKFTRSPSGVYDLGENAMLTTCTNDLDELHWKITGHFVYNTDISVTGSNLWLYFENIPVLWVPWFYYPLNTDYGLRVIPGYTKRWGTYVLTKYVYPIYRDPENSSLELGGSTYLNLRKMNGLELGQTIRWDFLDNSRGKIKAFHAWDNDYDRYYRHWSNSRRYNYANWGSVVEKDRYHVLLEHRTDFTERDSLNFRAQYISDSHYLHDFFRDYNRTESIPANEAWYEHRELSWAAGAIVSGPLNDFYGGVAKLPEAWLSIQPAPVLDLPINYESQTRAGFLNRQYEETASTDPMFRYNPYIGINGRGADYQAFRFDSSHRITAPCMIEDVVSFVPRSGYRTTWWSDSGDPGSKWVTASGESVYRGIAEVGATLSARANAWLTDEWQHIFEPYLDYSFQDAHFSAEDGTRAYIFDNYDASIDWMDQFGFEGRGLPFSWHGIRPGIRNYFNKRKENGIVDEILATDLYAAIPFIDEKYQGPRDQLPGYPEKKENGNYSRHDCFIPGFMARFTPSNRFSFLTRTEYDTDAKKVAYAAVSTEYRVSNDFKWNLTYIGRDHRIWEYVPSEYDRWNYHYSNIIGAGFEHRLCDWLQWSPFIRWDARCNEHDESGIWIDYLTDCLGFRFIIDHRSSKKRIDGSKFDCDFDIAFAIYLRALGAGSMLDYAKF